MPFWKKSKKQTWYGANYPMPRFPPQRVGEVYHPGESVPRMPSAQCQPQSQSHLTFLRNEKERKGDYPFVFLLPKPSKQLLLNAKSKKREQKEIAD
jgi:hypothetical protein